LNRAFRRKTGHRRLTISLIPQAILLVIPERIEGANLRGANCAPGNLEIPGSMLRIAPE